MNRESFLSAAPRVVLVAACVFAAARSSTSRLPDSPPCGSAMDGAGEAQTPNVAPDRAATQDPDAAPRWVQPVPLPTADDRSWLQEWLDLIARTGKAGSGC